MRQRLHRGPCRTAEQWAPTIAYYQERRAALDSIWSTPMAGQSERRVRDQQRYLAEFWEVLEDPRRFKREIELETSVDPELLGGVVVDTGDEVIDGSARGRLERLAHALMN